MRIPSSLTEDNLYSRHHRRTKGKSPHRLLMRLILAMVLVIAVMRQAGNPRIYEAFFLTPGGDVASQAPAIEPLPPPEPISDGPPRIDLIEATAPRTEKLLRVLADQLDQTLVILGGEKTAELMTELGQWRTANRDRIDSGDGVSPDRGKTAALSEPWIDRLNEAFSQTGQSIEDAIPTPDWTAVPWVLQLQSALDRWAILRVDPAAVWKGADTLAFYRILEDDPTRRIDDGASRASVISLIQQPEVYLHRRVLLPASVARAIRRPAVSNPFGVDQYWELWLRPRDGSERPFVMFTRQVSDAIAAIPADAAHADGPQVWVDGIFLKRIAYQSASGRELAPGIVGTLHEPAATTGGRAPAAGTAIASPRQGILLVAISALIGCSVAAWIFFQSGRAIARSRELRRKTRPSTPRFLASLGQDELRNRDSGEMKL
jgi:hypothetical protein